MTLPAGTRLGPYEIVEPLGAGGMGEVYRARDAKLERDVAIKVLPDAFARDADARARFGREAKAVAALSHENILAIHDFGTQEGTAYAVMELLEGETLRAKLDAGPIPLRQALGYGLQIARGLSAAHEKGIIHRDLKPENLFVRRDGHLKILDFGLAKRIEAAAPGDDATVPTEDRTEPGTVLGTVGYMAPEQVRGLPADHRSDIFSLGAILYEMLSGRKAFKKDTAIDTMTAIIRDEPPDLTGSGREIPVALDHAVRHCLEKERENRFQSVRDVAFALAEAGGSTAVPSGAWPVAAAAGRRRVLAAIAVLVVLAVTAGLLLRRAHSGARGLKRVAVLPFENLGVAEDDYFADGIADEVRGKLTSIPGLQVIARGSSAPYKKTNKTPKQIGQELEATYLLTATVRWDKGTGPSRVHVIPELVEILETGPPAVKWQQPFDASLTDVFQVQSDIASRVAEALGVALGSGDEKRLAEKPTESLAAYDAFLKGEAASKSMAIADPPGLRKALGFYEQAVALDPAFAQAWARVSMACSLLYGNAAPTPELAERARLAAEKSTTLAPNRPEGYLALGNYERMVLLDPVRALAQYARGQQVAPANADFLSRMAATEQSLGRWDAAVEHLRQAARLDPRSVAAQRRLGEALLWLRRYPEAREALDRGLALAPANLISIECKAMTYLGEGNLAAARAVLRAVPKEVDPAAFVAFVAQYWDLVWALDEGQRELLLSLTPAVFDDDRGGWGLCLAQACALKGDTACVRRYAEEARAALEEQLRSAPDDPQRHVYLGLALAFLGRRDEAIREGQRAVALLPVTKDAYTGASVQHQLARIDILVGEPERAIDQLGPLLKIPYLLSPGWLKVDPNFDPLRKNPRFQRLVAGAK